MSYTQTISDIRDGLPFAGRLLVKESGVRDTKNGKKFLNLRLVDSTGTIDSKIWDWVGDPIPVGAVLDVNAKAELFNGHMQLKMEQGNFKIVPDADVSALLPRAPETPENMYQEIYDTAAALRDPSLQGIVTFMLQDARDNRNLLSAPAAKSVHHATLGGLLYHTVTMLRAAKALAAVYLDLDKDLLYAGVIVHDLGKLDEMKVNELGLVDEYTTDGNLVGHIVRGVANIERAAATVGADQTRTLLLQHLVLSHHGEAAFGSPVPPKCPEAYMLSMLDRLDAHLFVMRDALAKIPEGTFSARIFSLGSEVYRAAGR